VGLGWVVPAIVGGLIGLGITFLRTNDNTNRNTSRKLIK